MRESAMVKKIKKAVKEKYPQAYIIKLSDRHLRHIPDLEIIIGEVVSGERVWARTVFVETKKPKTGRLSSGQIAEHAKIRRTGAVVIVARSVEEVMSQL